MSSDITDCVKRTLNRYFRTSTARCPRIYDMVLRAIEKPMLEVVMKQAEATRP